MGRRGKTVFVDRRLSVTGQRPQAGRGVGCVMGDKNLKALVACGEGGSIGVARPAAFLRAMDVALEKIRKSPGAEMMRRDTLAGRCSDPEYAAWDFLMSARNGQDDYWDPEKRRKLADPMKGFPAFRKRISACFACPVGCMPFSEVTEGPYAGTRGEGFWINTLMDAVRLDITDPAGIFRAWILSNEMGLDTDFITNVASWAFECYEKGLLSGKDTGGLNLTWGNVDAFLKLIKMVAYREGIGELLAHGVKEAAGRLGKGSHKFAIHMKGQDSIEAYRIAKAWALGVATSPAAGKHLRGSCTGGQVFGPKDKQFEAHVYQGQPENVLWQSLTKEMEDMLGLCVYVGTWSGAYALEPSDYSALANAVTGFELTEEDLFFMARRSYNLEKAFNTLHAGFTRKDDYPPERFMREAVRSGPYRGFRCERDQWDRMLDQFYRLQGWDMETGLQTEETLEALDLGMILEKFKTFKDRLPKEAIER